MSSPADRAQRPIKSEAAALLTELVLLVFQLDAGFIDAAEIIAAPAGLTAARWKVLGAVLETPRTVAEIGRAMGLTRQSVQRLADVLASEDLAAYLKNPAHKSAQLLTPTPRGRAAIAKLAGRQARWANEVTRNSNVKRLAACRDTLQELVVQVEHAASRGIF